MKTFTRTKSLEKTNPYFNGIARQETLSIAMPKKSNITLTFPSDIDYDDLQCFMESYNIIIRRFIRVRKKYLEEELKKLNSQESSLTERPKDD